MPVYAIGDVQGCDEELGELLRRIRFRPDRDRLWFVGDIVNRGPRSLEALRRVHALRDNSIVVLGNHDLHLLAVAHTRSRKLRAGDTLNALLKARDRDQLLEWLLGCPLFHHDAELKLSMVHAGLPPQWDLTLAICAAAEVHQALQTDAAGLFKHMYGDEPSQWSESLAGDQRLRFMVNCFARLRYCDEAGRINLKLKDSPGQVRPPWMPWFKVPGRASANLRIVCGHWSTLGYYDRDNVLAIDTGCVWGGSLCALRLDEIGRPILLGCAAHQQPGGE
ncbi:MAG TPA: symmetrical bis(5'-nucleosyl)-tetraphosphatase [Steroidobacteraceae bacterium]|nr:symmetrical bis(5'-nucleosyl)-tetraphosphatase [Steroidobacteraceae bacterium]